MRFHLARTVILVFAATIGCGGGGGPYGYARQYRPSDDEAPHYQRSVRVGYEEVRRNPEAYARHTLAWFGNVSGIRREAGGMWILSLEQRFHQPRHLCRDHSAQSCRVTVTDRVGDPYSAKLVPHEEDMTGKYALQVGALVKVYGRPTGEFDDNGGPIIDAAYYRHWPIGTFATAGGSAATRR